MPFAESNGSNAAVAEAPGPTDATPLDDGMELYCSTEVRILVLDDDETICRLIQAALTAHAFKVSTISDSSDMISTLKEREYHLIVLDYVIPEIDTQEILDTIQSHQPEASVIVVTGYPSVDSALQCLRAHTYDYITKPFQITHLQEVVKRCLQSKGLLRMSEAALLEALGSIIRERRKALGFTLAQMASRTGVSLGYLSQIELGKNSASIETLYRISLGLGVKLSDLFQSIQCREE